MTDISENKSAAVSRRNALKAGAALGVGAAAFAGPQIGVLGAAPAYAQTCSIAPVTVSGIEENVACTNACAPYFDLQTETVSVTFAGQTFDYTVSGCSNTDAAWVDGSPATIDCEVRVIPVVGGVDEPGIIVPGTAYCRETGPNNCSPNGYSCSSRYRIEVTCAQAGCL